MQPGDTPAIKAVELPGPALPGEEGLEDQDGKLIALRTQLANLRHVGTMGSMGADEAEANAHAVLDAEKAVDKLIVRMADAAIRHERLDRALQLITGCAVQLDEAGAQCQTNVGDAASSICLQHCLRVFTKPVRN